MHKDDEAEGGRIVQLAHDVVAQYELITGDLIQLFLDRDSLNWGDEWRSRVDASLASVAFFIPVLTPRYFQSAECRRELDFFIRRATRLGISELVMPILYVDVPGLREDAPTDNAMAFVKPFHYESWTELRFASPSSSEYRAAVARLAERLARANASAEVTEAPAVMERLEAEDDDAPGLLDQLERAESALPEWTETLNEIGREVEAIGALMQSAQGEMARADAQGKGFAGRLAVSRRLAGDLKGHTGRIRGFGDDFTQRLNEVDQGVRIIIERAPGEIEEDPSSREPICEFFESVRGMAAAWQEALGGLKAMIDNIAPIEKMARDLRPPLRELRQGLTVMYEGRVVVRSWLDLMDASGIDCPSAVEPDQ